MEGQVKVAGYYPAHRQMLVKLIQNYLSSCKFLEKL